MPLSRRGSVSARLSVWFSREQGGAERGEVGIQHLEPARIVRREPGLAFDHVQRGPLLRAELGQDQRAVRKIEAAHGRPCARASLPARASAAGPRSSGAARARDRLRARSRSACRYGAGARPRRPAAERIGGRAVFSSERARDPYRFQRPACDPLLQRLDVDRHVRQLGHASAPARSTAPALHRVAGQASVHVAHRDAGATDGAC